MVRVSGREGGYDGVGRCEMSFCILIDGAGRFCCGPEMVFYEFARLLWNGGERGREVEGVVLRFYVF